MLGFGAVVDWTKNKLSELVGDNVPISRADTHDALTTGRVALPSLDLFESDNDYLVALDVPGAIASNIHLTWNEVDTLLIHVRRAATEAETPTIREYLELDWFREVMLPADANGAKASAEVRQGILTIRVPKRLTLSGKLIPVYAA